jgi:hypothetical protein
VRPFSAFFQAQNHRKMRAVTLGKRQRFAGVAALS